MFTIKKTILAAAFGIMAAGFALPAAAQVPPGYPADYAKIIEGAKKEGKVIIYAATDSKAAEPLIKDFQSMYPGVKVEYNDMNSTEIYNRYIFEQAAGGATADVLWSSAMDLQIKLSSGAYGMNYKSEEAQHIPTWAVMNNTAYGTTYEPAVIVYNKRLVSADEVPTTHAAFTKLLTTKQEKFKDKVTTYDIEKSGLGFMFITQDLKNHPDGFWDMVKAMGAAGLRVQSSTGTMMERISSGENLIGYNMLGSYAIVRAKKDPNIGVQILKDYTMIMSRVMFISKASKNPNAAKLWLDYALSKRGQTLIANEAGLFAIRADVAGDATASGLAKIVGTALKPLPVDATQLEYLDQGKRLAFLKQWKEVTGKK
jgi:iron(III) transport system substrate-binding protein